MYFATTGRQAPYSSVEEEAITIGQPVRTKTSFNGREPRTFTFAFLLRLAQRRKFVGIRVIFWVGFLQIE